MLGPPHLALGKLSMCNEGPSRNGRLQLRKRSQDRLGYLLRWRIMGVTVDLEWLDTGHVLVLCATNSRENDSKTSRKQG